MKPAVPRVLQGNPIQANINARYFFGEPVAGAKVTYVVHTSTHYWWDQDEGDDNGDSADADPNDPDNSDDADDAYGQTEQQEHQGILDANGQLTVTLPTRIDPKHTDQDYRIEARVTDAANREVSGHSTVLATYGSFRVSVEPTNYVVGRPADARESDSAGLRRQTGADKSAHCARRSRSGIQSRTSAPTPDAGSKDAVTGADGTALVDLPSRGSGDFEVKASAQTPENRTVEGPHLGLGLERRRRVVSGQRAGANRRRQKILLAWATPRTCCSSPGLAESWAVVTTEGDSVQSRAVIHSTSASAAIRCSHHAARLSRTSSSPRDRPQQPADDGAKELQGSASRAHADHYSDAQQNPIRARATKPALTCSRWIPRASLFRPI